MRVTLRQQKLTAIRKTRLYTDPGYRMIKAGNITLWESLLLKVSWLFCWKGGQVYGSLRYILHVYPDLSVLSGVLYEALVYWKSKRGKLYLLTHQYS